MQLRQLLEQGSHEDVLVFKKYAKFVEVGYKVVQLAAQSPKGVI